MKPPYSQNSSMEREDTIGFLLGLFISHWAGRHQDASQMAPYSLYNALLLTRALVKRCNHSGSGGDQSGHNVRMGWEGGGGSGTGRLVCTTKLWCLGHQIHRAPWLCVELNHIAVAPPPLPWSSSESAVMTILFSTLVADAPPFTTLEMWVVVVVMEVPLVSLLLSEVMDWMLLSAVASFPPSVPSTDTSADS